MKVEFKIGQTVRLKAQKKAKVFIIEIQQQTCYANVGQVWYTGRIIWDSSRYGGGGSVDKTYSKFSQIELEACPEPSMKLQTLIEGLKRIKSKKEVLIKKQDFEKAANMRDEIRKLELEVECLAEKEGIDYRNTI